VSFMICLINITETRMVDLSMFILDLRP
jgi:hypothetical protein